MKIRKGIQTDIDGLEKLYNDLNDYLSSHTNYPGWRKGIYPTREDAVKGIEENNLFLAVEDNRIVGTVILRHEPEEGYQQADWHVDLDYSEILVVYTLAVHPDYRQQGAGKKLMEFVLGYAKKAGMKAVRLDVYEKNIPAIKLYEKMGFEYIDTVDLGYGMYRLGI